MPFPSASNHSKIQNQVFVHGFKKHVTSSLRALPSQALTLILLRVTFQEEADSDLIVKESVAYNN